MNGEQPDRRRKLLNEIFYERLVEKGGDARKRRALTELRYAASYRRRLSAWSFVGISGLLGIGIGVFWGIPTRREAGDNMSMRPISMTAKSAPMLNKIAAIPETQLTDVELLACFPTNTCFLAEVEGRKILVFRSRELRQLFLR